MSKNNIPQKLAEELGIVKKKVRKEKAIVAPVELRGLPVKWMRLLLPYPPPDNHYYTIWMNRKIPSADAKKYWKEVSIACTAQEARHVIGRLTLTITSHHEANYQYDIGNLVKAVQDSLTKAGVYLDDRFIDNLHVHRGAINRDPSIAANHPYIRRTGVGKDNQGKRENAYVSILLEGEEPASVDLFADMPVEH